MLQKNFYEDPLNWQDAAKFGDSMESGSAGDSWGTRGRDGGNQGQPPNQSPQHCGNVAAPQNNEVMPFYIS